MFQTCDLLTVLRTYCTFIELEGDTIRIYQYKRNVRQKRNLNKERTKKKSSIKMKKGDTLIESSSFRLSRGNFLLHCSGICLFFLSITIYKYEYRTNYKLVVREHNPYLIRNPTTKFRYLFIVPL